MISQYWFINFNKGIMIMKGDNIGELGVGTFYTILLIFL